MALLALLAAPAPAPAGPSANPGGEAAVAGSAPGTASDGAPAAGPAARLIGSFDWQDDRPRFGGFSGIEMAPDGLSALVLSDRGYIIEARISRDAAGRITAISGGPSMQLLTSRGEPVAGANADSEGVTRLPDGRFCVSFENNARVSCYERPGAAAQLLPRHADFAAMPVNGSLEALAADADGRLYTLPEDPGAGADFPVYRFDGDGWEQPFSLPGRGAYLATGADFGPDGRFYLLERRFTLAGGFISRIRSFAIGPEGASDERLHLETAPFRHGNLEGISVWRDREGRLRLTLIADNAQLGLFWNEIAEYFID